MGLADTMRRRALLGVNLEVGRGFGGGRSIFHVDGKGRQGNGIRGMRRGQGAELACVDDDVI